MAGDVHRLLALASGDPSELRKMSPAARPQRKKPQPGIARCLAVINL
jgi:hypothetical protein